jgi:5-methylcytosine-specific restriction endonuclease McrA
MRDYAKIAPQFWTDHLGREWKEPTIVGRLKMRIPSHRALRDFVIHRGDRKCAKCSSCVRLVADHVVSRRNGGRHHPSNMQCLCGSCNSRKASVVDAKAVPHA